MVVLFDSENASVYIGHLCPALEGGEPPNYELYDAEEVMLHAWDLVTPMTITRCCRHAGIKHPGGTGSTHDEDEEECLPLVQLAARLQADGIPCRHMVYCQIRISLRLLLIFQHIASSDTNRYDSIFLN